MDQHHSQEQECEGEQTGVAAETKAASSSMTTTAAAVVDEEEEEEEDDDEEDNILEKSYNNRFHKRNKRFPTQINGVDNTFIAIEPKSGKEVIWNERILSEKKMDRATRFLTIVKKLKKHSHPFLVRFLDAWITKGPETEPKKLVFITERLDEGTLKQFLCNSTSRSKLLWRRHIGQLLSVLIFLHQLNVTHGNLKKETIYYQNSGNLKVGPFMLDAFFGQKALSSDISALGIVALEIAAWTQAIDTSASTEDERIKAMLDSLVDQQQQSFIGACREPNVASRPKIRALLNHPAVFEVPSLKLLSAKVFVTSSLGPLDGVSVVDSSILKPLRVITTSEDSAPQTAAAPGHPPAASTTTTSNTSACSASPGAGGASSTTTNTNPSGTISPGGALASNLPPATAEGSLAPVPPAVITSTTTTTTTTSAGVKSDAGGASIAGILKDHLSHFEDDTVIVEVIFPSENVTKIKLWKDFRSNSTITSKFLEDVKNGFYPFMGYRFGCNTGDQEDQEDDVSTCGANAPTTNANDATTSNFATGQPATQNQCSPPLPAAVAVAASDGGAVSSSSTSRKHSTSLSAAPPDSHTGALSQPPAAVGVVSHESASRGALNPLDSKDDIASPAVAASISMSAAPQPPAPLAAPSLLERRCSLPNNLSAAYQLKEYLQGIILTGSTGKETGGSRGEGEMVGNNGGTGAEETLAHGGNGIDSGIPNSSNFFPHQQTATLAREKRLRQQSVCVYEPSGGIYRLDLPAYTVSPSADSSKPLDLLTASVDHAFRSRAPLTPRASIVVPPGPFTLTLNGTPNYDDENPKQQSHLPPPRSEAENDEDVDQDEYLSDYEDDEDDEDDDEDEEEEDRDTEGYDDVGPSGNDQNPSGGGEQPITTAEENGSLYHPPTAAAAAAAASGAGTSSGRRRGGPGEVNGGGGGGRRRLPGGSAGIGAGGRGSSSSGRLGGTPGALQVVHVTPPTQAPSTSALFTHCQYSYIGAGRWQVYVQMWFVEERLKREAYLQVLDNEWHDYDRVVDLFEASKCVSSNDRDTLVRLLAMARHNMPLIEGRVVYPSLVPQCNRIIDTHQLYSKLVVLHLHQHAQEMLSRDSTAVLLAGGSAAEGAAVAPGGGRALPAPLAVFSSPPLAPIAQSPFLPPTETSPQPVVVTAPLNSNDVSAGRCQLADGDEAAVASVGELPGVIAFPSGPAPPEAASPEPVASAEDVQEAAPPLTVVTAPMTIPNMPTAASIMASASNPPPAPPLRSCQANQPPPSLQQQHMLPPHHPLIEMLDVGCLAPTNAACPACDHHDYLHRLNLPGYLISPCYHCRESFAKEAKISPEDLLDLHLQHNIPWPGFLQARFKIPDDGRTHEELVAYDCRWRDREPCTCLSSSSSAFSPVTGIDNNSNDNNLLHNMPPCVEFPWLYNSRHQHHCSGGSSSAGGGGVDGVSGRDVVTPPQQPDVEQDPSLSTAMMGGSEGEAPDSPSQATSDPKGDDNAESTPPTPALTSAQEAENVTQPKQNPPPAATTTTFVDGSSPHAPSAPQLPCSSRHVRGSLLPPGACCIPAASYLLPQHSSHQVRDDDDDHNDDCCDGNDAGAVTTRRRTPSRDAGAQQAGHDPLANTEQQPPKEENV